MVNKSQCFSVPFEKNRSSALTNPHCLYCQVFQRDMMTLICLKAFQTDNATHN